MMLLRDQIVIQIGEEIDGMVMIRSGDNRQGVCPLKFLQEVWHLSEVACQVTNVCNCKKIERKTSLKKIYYPNFDPPNIKKNKKQKNKNKKSQNSTNIFQYYYNNINEKSKNNVWSKQTNINNNILPYNQNKNFKFVNNTKAPFSSTKRPLSFRLSTPKHVTNLFNKTFRYDSQKRPLLLNVSNCNLTCDEYQPNFRVIPEKSGLKISSIYTISEDVEKFTIYRRNLYISSNSRPLFVRK